MSDNEARIKELLHQGKHAQAAEILLEIGDLKRAMEAYAAIWDYARAAEIAIAANDRAAALDFLLRDGDRTGAARVLVRLSQADEDEAERAVELLLERGERDHAARLLEARGELRRAAELIKDQGEVRRAAALLERAGAHREAGRLYERLVNEDSSDTASALALGNILRRFGKHQLAARMLQVASKDQRLRKQALRGLVVTLHTLGMRDAAESALEELLDIDGSAPRSVDALVASEEDTNQGGVKDDGHWVAGRYHVTRVLGGGAAGRVYLARDALYEREVALKVLAAGAGDGAGRDAFGRFKREAQIAAKLDHPNIVRVLDFDASSGVLVMEYLGGGTLGDKLSEGPVSLALARHVFEGVLAALGTAHLRGVVHRDVKPENVLFARGGGVKLADFGVAHLQDLGLTQTGAFIGTLTYMAPEQITGARVSAGTDLYGLGATVFHALCGRPPFVGADLVRQHLAETPPLPSEVRPGLGTRFDALMARLLAKTPDDRFESAADVLRALKEIDFTEPDEDHVITAPPPEPIEENEEELLNTFEEEEETTGGVYRRAQNRLLDAPVFVLDVDEARLSSLEAFGRALSPYLQCVLDVDRETGRAVLESPSGELLAQRVRAIEHTAPIEAVALASNIGEALATLHQVGVAHGSVDMEHVVTGTYGATLLLPDSMAEATPDDDRQALQTLLGALLGASGELAGLYASGPLAEALGPRRSVPLGEQARSVGDLSELRALLRGTEDALEERRRAGDQIHALAAAARAAGVDPASGAVAELLEQRRSELDA